MNNWDCNLGISEPSSLNNSCIPQRISVLKWFDVNWHRNSLTSTCLQLSPLFFVSCFFSGFDHQHPEVYEHCKRLLLHLLVVQGANGNVQSVAMVLLRNRDYNEPRVLTVKPAAPEFNLTGQLCCEEDLKSKRGVF